jgi:hypothetical protein
VGEISQAQWTHIRDLPPTSCTTSNDLTCRGEQMAPEKVGWTFGLVKPPLTKLLLQRWSVQHYPQLPPNLSLNKYKSWSLKLNSIHLCYLLLMNNAHMHHTLSKFFEKWHVHNMFKIEDCIKIVAYTYTYACGKIF